MAVVNVRSRRPDSRGSAASRASRVVGAGARLRLQPDRARAGPDRGPRRLPVRDGDLLQPVRLLGRVTRQFIGLQNFRDILGNEIFQQTVYNSFVFSLIAVVFKTVLGVWLAMLLFRNFKFKRLIRGAVLLPWVIPTALSVLVWGGCSTRSTAS